MPSARVPLAVVFLACWPWVSYFAQTTADPGTLRFAHSFERERERMLLEYRSGAATDLLTAARELVSLPEDAGSRRTSLLNELQYLSDSMTVLDRQIAEAMAAVVGARDNLVRGLESQAQRETDGERRNALRAEIAELRNMDDAFGTTSLTASDTTTLEAVARVVAEERTRLRLLRRLQDELRLFLGRLRLFDETGMPPSVRADAGSGTDPGAGCGCELPVARATTAPGDLPMEHFRSRAEGEDRFAGTTTVDLASLGRLQEQLRGFLGAMEEATTVRASKADGIVTRSLTLETSLLTFRDDGDGLTGFRLEAGSSLLLPISLGRGLRLSVEPRVGGRALRLDPGSSTEAAGDLWENLTGSAGGGRFRWQVTSWQKGRYLSEPLPLPAYLEPGRSEGGLTSRAALSIHPRWDVELGGGGNVVRYGPEEWEGLDRDGLNAFGALARYGVSGYGRLSLSISRARFAMQDDVRRMDTRLSAVADWVLEGRVVLRLSVGGAWNDSRLAAYDYRSGRAAVALSTPWWGNSIQLYGALAHRSYLNPGPENARVAPSDQDTGSIVALQLARPINTGQALALRAEWSRSETGFRNDFYQRFGITMLLSFRGLGGG